MGTIHGMLAAEVHPNQNMEMGRRRPPTIATGRRFSGMKSVTRSIPGRSLGAEMRTLWAICEHRLEHANGVDDEYGKGDYHADDEAL